MGGHNKIHGEGRNVIRTPEYRTWNGIKNRCYNPNCLQYKYYGERGITVCDRWRTSYVAFLTDMGRRPSKRHSIERINNNEGYSPNNCKWALPYEQIKNRRNTAMIDGVPLVQLARLHGILPSVLAGRIKSGWSIEDALLRPVHVPQISSNLPLAQLARLYGIPYSTVRSRVIRGGWSVQDALLRPVRKQDGGRP